MSTFDDMKSAVSAACPELTNTSSASLWQRILSSIYLIIDALKKEITNTATLIQTWVATGRYGTRGYYERTARAFQYGDNLLFDDTYTPYYATIDPTKQIIAQAAVEEIISSVSIDEQEYQFSSVLLKVATSSNGTLQPLSEEQLSAFTIYMSNFTLLGIPLQIFSSNPDMLQFDSIKITLAPEYDESATSQQVVQAFYNFRDQSTFDGILYLSNLTAYILANVPGVIDVYLDGAQIQPFGGDFTPIANGQTSLKAGYFDYSNDLETFVNYVSAN